MNSKIDYVSVLILLTPTLVFYLTAIILFGSLLTKGIDGFIISGLSALIGAIIGAILLKFVFKRKI